LINLLNPEEEEYEMQKRIIEEYFDNYEIEGK
jgi:hypothetical protein